MASFEKLGGQFFFENCKEVWGHASLKNLKYRHSEVQSCWFCKSCKCKEVL